MANMAVSRIKREFKEVIKSEEVSLINELLFIIIRIRSEFFISFVSRAFFYPIRTIESIIRLARMCRCLLF